MTKDFNDEIVSAKHNKKLRILMHIIRDSLFAQLTGKRFMTTVVMQCLPCLFA
jgi:hypothetical protein